MLNNQKTKQQKIEKAEENEVIGKFNPHAENYLIIQSYTKE